MKNILFVLVQDGMGGIEKSFISLARELSKDPELKIDVVFFTHKNRLIKHISTLNVYPENKWMSLIGKNKNEIKSMQFRYKVLRLIAGFMNKYLPNSLGYKILMYNSEIDKKYDIAISYQHSTSKSLYGGTNDYVINKVNADEKIAFIHGDLEYANLITRYNRRMYNKFDKIACVSRSCKDLIDEVWPELKSKTYIVKNGCDVYEINQSAGEGYKRDKGKICFITIARLDKVKGIYRTLDALSFVKKRGYNNFIWYVIGGGDEIDKYISHARYLDLENNVIFLGEKENPYYYLKSMDALLVLSYQEAAPVVFYEAACLGVPVISTNTRSAKELITDKRNGIVCENNLKSIQNALMHVMQNRDILFDLKSKMTIKKDNYESVESFYKMIN